MKKKEEWNSYQVLNFEMNKGQHDERVKFLVRGRGYIAFFTSTEVIFKVQQENQKIGMQKLRLDEKLKAQNIAKESDSQIIKNMSAFFKMRLEGANLEAEVKGEGVVEGYCNYFKGNNPDKWLTHIPMYQQIRYEHIYPGIDWVHYGKGRQLEYDLVLRPGANLDQIRIHFEGVEKVAVNHEGNLILQTKIGELKFLKPRIYQEINEVIHEIAGGYEIQTNQEVGFWVEEYNKEISLKIDPGLAYSTFLGGSSYEAGTTLAVDELGNAYVVGTTNSNDFPTTPGAYDTLLNGLSDAFITKLNANGTGLIYSTFLGGSSAEQGHALSIDRFGNVYIAGHTESRDFPTTPGAYSTSFSGGYSDAFITKLNASGTALIYSTFLGGSGRYDSANAIAIDRLGNAYITGHTWASNFPTTPGAFDTSFNGGTDAFVTKLNSNGTALVYSTFLGGNRYDYGENIVIDEIGNAYIVGWTNSSNFPTTPGAFDVCLSTNGKLFITKLNATGTGLIYSTFLGGSSYQEVGAIDIDRDKNIYITGLNQSSDFPTTKDAYDTTFNGNSDVFVTKLNANGTGLIYSTFIGGSGHDYGYAMVIDEVGNAYITGGTGSSNFPTTEDAYDTTYNGNTDSFIVQLNESGSQLVYSTFFGGSSYEDGRGIARDKGGNIYITGYTNSADLPTTVGAYDTFFNGADDVFVAKFKLACKIDIPTECCQAEEIITLGSCEDYKAVTLPLVEEGYKIQCSGRLLSIAIRISSVCPNRQMTIGVILYEQIEDQLINRGFRAVTVATSNLDTTCKCNTLEVSPFEFVLPEEGDLCDERQFKVKVIAHYSDVLKEYKVNCNF